MSDKVTRLFSTSIGRQSKLCSGHAPRRHECGLVGVRQEAGAGGAIISFDAVCGLAFRLTATVTTVKKAVYRLEPLLRRQGLMQSGQAVPDPVLRLRSRLRPK